MSGFIYFIEGHAKALTRDVLDRLGLAYITDDPRGVPYNAEWGLGPSGAKGWCVCDQRRMGDWQPVFRPEEQTWRRLAARGASSDNSRLAPSASQLWVGHYNAAKPKRQALARARLVPGYAVTLADGEAWQVPLVRQCVGHVGEGRSELALPTYVDCDDFGRPIAGAVVDEYRALAELVAPFWDAWVAAWRVAAAAGKEKFAVDVADWQQMAAGVLSANYALSFTEACMLRLFRSDEGAADVLQASCDCDWATVALKKTAEPPADSATADSAIVDSSSSAGDAA